MLLHHHCELLLRYCYSISHSNFGFSVFIETDIILINIFVLPARADLSRRGRD